MKRLSLTLIFLISVISSFAYDVKIDENSYYLDKETRTAKLTRFRENSSLNRNGIVAIPATITYADMTIPVTSIGNCAFEYNTAIKSVIIPNSVTLIEDGAFRRSSLTTIDIPNSVKSIGEGAFQECESLKSVTLPSSMTRIEGGTFSGCKKLTTVKIPNSVTSIGNSAFSGCFSLTSITIPSSVTNIGEAAFAYCTSLRSINIPESVTSIKNRTFSGCNSLTSINIPNSVTSIGANTFSECSSLTSVSLPNSLRSIEVDLFDGCTSLTSITIPSSVTRIYDEAFYNCKSLREIRLLSPTPPSPIWGMGDHKAVFYGVDLLACKIFVPTGAVEKYKNAEGWKDFWNILPLEENRSTNNTQNAGNTQTNESSYDSTAFKANYEAMMQQYDRTKDFLYVFETNRHLNESDWMKNEREPMDDPLPQHMSKFNTVIIDGKEFQDKKEVMKVLSEKGKHVILHKMTYPSNYLAGFLYIYWNSPKFEVPITIHEVHVPSSITEDIYTLIASEEINYYFYSTKAPKVRYGLHCQHSYSVCNTTDNPNHYRCTIHTLPTANGFDKIEKLVQKQNLGYTLTIKADIK